jgi:MFS transporter, DHA2 family, multidrug resistance protein
VLTVPALLASMDLSVLFIAAPQLSAALTPSGPQLLWIMDIYGFLMGGLLLTMGALGDRIGRRRVLLAGALVFGVASVLAAYAPTAELLIAARALLGVGGATLAPSCLALIRTMFPDGNSRRVAIAVFTGAFTGGIALGPIVGGALLVHYWWGAVFLINVPVMLLLLVAGPALLPESIDPNPGRRFDVPSAVLSMSAVLSLMYGIKELAAAGHVEWRPLVAIAIGAVAGVVFVRRQLGVPDPLLDVGLFRNGGFTAAFGVYTLLVLGSAGMGYLVNQHMQLVLGLRPLSAALWQLPPIGTTVVGIVLATALVRRIRQAVLAGAGLGLAALGFAMVSALDPSAGVGVLVLAYSVLTLGTGLLAPLAIDLIVTTAPPERAGSAAAMGETGAEFGGALGIAVLGSVATAVFRGHLADAVPAVAADPATGTLAGALALAERLPADLAATMREAAPLAFAAGFRTAAVVAAVLMVATAVAATARLWHVRVPADTSV